MRAFMLSLMVCIAPLLKAETTTSIFDHLSFDEQLAVTIEMDLDVLSGDFRNDDKHSATIHFENQYQQQETWDIQVKLRGKFRRMRCNETPPLKLYFDKNDLRQAGLAKFDDLKLVNVCHEDLYTAKELLLKEYLAYQMYQELTDASFRVQLLKITYQDTNSKKKLKRWGFLIEDLAQVRARLVAEKLNDENKKNILADEEYHIMSLFQYMIGNADWNISARKNLKLIAKDEQLIPVPYDFDFSGLVNPSYGIPNTSLGLERLTQRVYLGNTKDIEQLEETIELFVSKKEVLLKTITDNKHLSWEAKSTVMVYVEDFYNNLGIKKIMRAVPKKNPYAEKTGYIK